MSPSRSAEKQAKKLDAKNKRKAAFACTREAKRRRLQLKRERNEDDEVKGMREGDTYESNIGKISHVLRQWMTGRGGRMMTKMAILRN